MDEPFTHRFRVRYSEVDPQAVVFNSRYLEYADLLVTEFFRTRGIGFASEDAVEFHVARAVVEFHQPLRADELVEGRLSVDGIGNSSVKMTIALHGAEDPTGTGPRATIELVNVHVDLATGESLRVPDQVRARLLGEEVRANG